MCVSQHNNEIRWNIIEQSWIERFCSGNNGVASWWLDIVRRPQFLFGCISTAVQQVSSMADAYYRQVRQVRQGGQQKPALTSWEPRESTFLPLWPLSGNLPALDLQRLGSSRIQGTNSAKQFTSPGPKFWGQEEQMQSLDMSWPNLFDIFDHPIMAINGRHCYWHAKHHQTPNACGQFGCLAFCEQICRNTRRYCKKSKTLRVCCVTFKDSVARMLFASLGVTKNFAAVTATLMPVQLSVPHWLTIYSLSDAWLTLVQCVHSGESLHWCGRNFGNVWLAFACIQKITPPNPPKSGGSMSPKIGAESTVNKIPAGLIWFIIIVIIVLSYIALNWRHPQFSDTFFGRQRRGSFRMGQLRSGFLAPRGGMMQQIQQHTTSISISMQWYLCHLQYFVLHMVM